MRWTTGSPNVTDGPTGRCSPRRTRGTWARTCPVNRASSCCSSAVSRSISTFAPRSPTPDTRASACSRIREGGMVATFLVTGSASGMGQAAAERLRSSGHRVIGVDVKDADVVADLSTDTGRAVAAAAVVEQCGGVLDGAVLAAGLGPIAGRDRLIVQVNYFGVVTLLTALQPALARSGRAKVVVVSSNSTTTTPAVPRRAVRALLDGDAERALRAVRWFGKRSSPMIYAASKIAVSRWVRRH